MKALTITPNVILLDFNSIAFKKDAINQEVGTFSLALPNLYDFRSMTAVTAYNSAGSWTNLDNKTNTALFSVSKQANQNFSLAVAAINVLITYEFRFQILVVVY